MCLNYILTLSKEILKLKHLQSFTFCIHCCESKISIFKKLLSPRTDYQLITPTLWCNFPLDWAFIASFLLHSMLVPCTKRVSSRCFLTRAWISSFTFWSSLRESLEPSTSYFRKKRTEVCIQDNAFDKIPQYLKTRWQKSTQIQFSLIVPQQF